VALHELVATKGPLELAIISTTGKRWKTHASFHSVNKGLYCLSTRQLEILGSIKLIREGDETPTWQHTLERWR